MAEPTDDQLREYAVKLPQIYKDILCAFPKFAPDRIRFEPLLESTLIGEVLDADESHRTSLIEEALKTLTFQNLLSTNQDYPGYGGGYGDGGGGGRPAPQPIRYWPTETGERLIEILSGHKAKKVSLPALPKPTWS